MALPNVVRVIQTLRAPMEQKGRGWANFLSAGAETSISSCPRHQSSWFSGRRPQAGSYTVASLVWFPDLLTWTELHSWFSSLQMVDTGTSCPPKPREIIPIIKLLLYLSISYWSVSLENPDSYIQTVGRIPFFLAV